MTRTYAFSNLSRDVSIGGGGAARELATVFSVTLFLSNNSWSIGQNTPYPPKEGVSGHHRI